MPVLRRCLMAFNPAAQGAHLCIGSAASVLYPRPLCLPAARLQVRGVPALSYFGQQVWGGVVDELAAGQGRKYFLLGGKVRAAGGELGAGARMIALVIPA